MKQFRELFSQIIGNIEQQKSAIQDLDGHANETLTETTFEDCGASVLVSDQLSAIAEDQRKLISRFR